MSLSVESRSQIGQLPVISGETGEKLLDGLNLDSFINVSPEKRVHPTVALSRFSEGVTDQVAAENPVLVSSIYEALSRTYTNTELSVTQVNHYKVNASTNGMAVVLEAYDLETGKALFQSLQGLTPADIDQIVVPTLVENVAPLDYKRRLFRRAKTRKSIPYEQEALNKVLNEAYKSAITYPGVFKDGAVAMYQVLGQIWPKVF